MSEPSDYRERGGGHHESGPHIGIYGWRKRCLYLLILTLLVLVILNLALTLWVLKVMEFNTEGMGNIRIVEGGLEVTGQSYILGNLVATSIHSRLGQPIVLRGSHNITLTTEHYAHNTLTLEWFVGEHLPDQMKYAVCIDGNIIKEPDDDDDGVCEEASEEDERLLNND